MRLGRPTRRPVAAVLLVLASVLTVAATRPGVRSPRTPDDIGRLLAEGPHRGECSTCHTQHGTYDIPYDHALLGPDDNTLCAGCHDAPWTGGSYPGTGLYAGSSHGSEPTVIWPGPTPPPRVEPSAQNKCVNCHDPHGWEDGNGLIPHLAVAREEALCLTCHDGSPGFDNIAADQLKPYRHPTQDFGGRHTGAGESLPQDFGQVPLNKRHAECTDCHNGHTARADRTPPTADRASKSLLGVSRIAVANGVAGTVPAYTFIPASDTLSNPGGQWQVCFKCHSSWTSQPSGQTDLARVLNPNNPSYHPVEATGRDLTLDPGSFVTGWSPSSRTDCGDCHGSEDGQARGPHGSLNRYILNKPYDPNLMVASDPGDLCFSCHRYDVYANPSGPPALQGSSRFNRPAEQHGHAFHAGREVACGSCHTTHGSTGLRHLLVTGRNPGLSSISQTPTGGSCTSTCHGPETYSINYAR